MENKRFTLDEVMINSHLCSVFRKIMCIGDSLSSGEYESTKADGSKGYHDFYEYSWGQFIARTRGAEVINASRGGMTAKEFVNGFADWKGFFGSDYASQAYIIALGVNDKGQPYPTGSVDDVCDEDWKKNKETFAGYYGAIIQRIKIQQPKAKIFLVTVPNETNRTEEIATKYAEQRKLLYDFAKKFEHTFVLDLYERAPIYDEKMHEEFFCGGHMNAFGYLFTAEIIMKLMDEIIASDYEEFSQVGFIGKGGMFNAHQKW